MSKGGFGLKDKAHGLKGNVSISNTTIRSEYGKNNTGSGHPKMQPVVKGNGADEVSRVKAGNDRDIHQLAFSRMTENQARKLTGE